jgi:hypothetical protein
MSSICHYNGKWTPYKNLKNELACKKLYHVNAKRRRLKYMHFIFYLNNILANKLLKTL